MNIRRKFNETDLQRIKEAVQQAESKISGEIVPVIVERSGHYAIANYRAAIVAASLAFLSIIVFDRYVPTLAIYDPLVIFVIIASIGFMGALAAQYVDPLKKLMLSQQHMDKSTHLKAQSYFLQEEVFNTRQRTGIMIFVSFFEHEVIVMADRGISKVVEQKDWDRVVRGLIEKIKLGNVTEGIVAAIEQCGQILIEKEFLINSDDTNELKDDLRIE
jgi:putative membrane protein